MSRVSFDVLKQMRDDARLQGKALFATLEGRKDRVVAISSCAPGYGGVGFRVASGGGWYPITGAPWRFVVRP